MYKSYLTISLAFLVSLDLQAAEKGFLFSIGESILKLSGHSYVELESKVSAHETNATKCLNMNSKLKDVLVGREKDIKDCKEYEKFKASPAERTIGYNLIDVLTAGCTGHIKLTKTRFGSNSSSESEQKEEIDNDFESKYLKDRRSLEFLNLKKSVTSDRHQSYFDRTIDIKLSRFFHNNKLPSIVLGRIYEINEESSGGTLGKGVYKYKYNIVKNDKSQLELVIEGETAEQWTHMPVGEKNVFKLTGLCKSVEEIDKIAESSKEEKVDEDIRKKVFGN